MDFVPAWAYQGLTVVFVVALLSVGYLRAEYAIQDRRLAWLFFMSGWAAITWRFIAGLWGDQTISYAGAIGLLLLAIATVLEAMRR